MVDKQRLSKGDHLFTAESFRLSYASRTGVFAATNLPALSEGLGWVVQYLSTNVILSVTGSPPASTGYDAWAAGITNGLTNYWESATGDGYANLLKYATGSSPTTPDDLAKMGYFFTNGQFHIRFNRDTNATDVIYIVEASSSAANNATWVGISTNIAGVWNPPVAVETGAGSPVSVLVPDNVIGPRFVRLVVGQ